MRLSQKGYEDNTNSVWSGDFQGNSLISEVFAAQTLGSEFDFQNVHKKPGKVIYACYHSVEEKEADESLGLAEKSAQVNQISPRPVRDLVSKTQDSA